MDINEIIERVHHIPEASADKLASCLSEMSLPKGFRVLEAGKVETDIYFIRRGLARAFIPVDGEEITFWLGKEGVWNYAQSIAPNNFISLGKVLGVVEIILSIGMFLLQISVNIALTVGICTGIVFLFCGFYKTEIGIKNKFKE